MSAWEGCIIVTIGLSDRSAQLGNRASEIHPCLSYVWLTRSWAAATEDLGGGGFLIDFAVVFKSSPRGVTLFSVPARYGEGHGKEGIRLLVYGTPKLIFSELL